MAYQSWRPPYPPAPTQNGAGGNYYQPPPPPPPAVAQVDPFRSYYADRLRQLTFNSRPLIQELSVMAMQQRDGNNWDAMKAVVEEIETAVLRASPQAKLPLLYLIDSISKNVGAPYTTHLLPPIIPRLYTKTYREVDGHTKSRMDEVIKLWGHTGPNNTPLYGPGVKEAVDTQIYGPNAPSRQQVLDLLNSTLTAKRHEISYNPAVHGQLAILSQISDVVNTQNVSPQELGQIMEQLKGMMAASAPPRSQVPPPPPPPQMNHYGAPRPPFPPNPSMGIGHPPNPAPNLPPFPPRVSSDTYRATPPPSSLSTPQYPPQRDLTPQPPSAPLPFDVAKLLKTINAGSLSQARTPEPKSALDAYEDLIINMNVKLTIADINVPRTLPNAQLPERCRTCGIRMSHDDEKMRAHMDWHFRRNRKDRDGQGRGAHRKWLPKAEEWANEVPQAGPSSGREITPVTGPKLTAAKLASLRKRWIKVPTDPAKKGLPCPVCKELHKPEWAEDEEEWVFRNAIDISGTIYHATCRAEQMSLTKLMKEEGKRSKSASPVVTAPESGKVEKRKPEDEVDDDDLSKRARLAAGVEAEKSTVPPPQSQPITAEESVQTNTEITTPTSDATGQPNETIQESVDARPSIPAENGTEQIVVKQEIAEGAAGPVPEGMDADEDEDAVDSSVLVKTEPEIGPD